MTRYIVFHVYFHYTDGPEFCYIPVNEYFNSLMKNTNYIDLSEYDETIALDVCKKADEIGIGFMDIKYPINVIGTIYWHNYKMPPNAYEVAKNQKKQVEDILKNIDTYNSNTNKATLQSMLDQYDPKYMNNT